jgi:hypothetical protein
VQEYEALKAYWGVTPYLETLLAQNGFVFSLGAPNEL